MLFGSSHTLAQASGACALRHFDAVTEQLLREFNFLDDSRGTMTRSHSKGPASWVKPASVAFAGLCIFGASLVIHEPLEKIANRESYTVVVLDKTTESLKSSPLQVRPNPRN